MPDENEVVYEGNPNPIVGVQGPTTPPVVTGRITPDERRKRRFGTSGSAQAPAPLGSPSNRGRERFEGTSEYQAQSAPANQEESGEPAAESSLPDQASQEEAPSPRRQRFGVENAAVTYPTTNEQAKHFAQDLDNLSGSNVFTSMPHLCKSSLVAYRKWHQVPESVSDDDLKAGIDPAILAVILQIVQQVLACLPNNKDMAWGRVVSYSNAKPFERLGDNVRLNAMINRWMDMLAVPRESGDVVVVRNAITEAAASLKPEEFAQLQQEANFLTI